MPGDVPPEYQETPKLKQIRKKNAKVALSKKSVKNISDLADTWIDNILTSEAEPEPEPMAAASTAASTVTSTAASHAVSKGGKDLTMLRNSLPKTDRQVPNRQVPNHQVPNHQVPNRQVPNRRKLTRAQRDIKLLHEIWMLQTRKKMFIPFKPFLRVVREVTQEFKHDYRWNSEGVKALQESAEFFLSNAFEKSYECTRHANRVTLKPEDMKLALRLSDANCTCKGKSYTS